MTISGTWTPLKGATLSQLRLATTLFNGQSFSWIQTDAHSFSNVVQGTLVTLRQTPVDESVHFRIHGALSAHRETIEKMHSTLSHYFHLSVDSDALFEAWNRADPNFVKRTGALRGIRLLRQPPVETLFAFICSANNNISRITGMVLNLKKRYGLRVGSISVPKTRDASSVASLSTKTVEESEFEELDFYSFPTIADLCVDGVEKTLRELGFGYRAAYIATTARMLNEKQSGGEEWLMNLRNLDYLVAKESLLELMGIGPKVADCILLMSLDKFGAIPVDTHVWRLAKRDYGLSSSAVTNSVSAKNYQAVGNKFREIFGEHAGWAQSLLFSAEINVNSKRGRSDKEARDSQDSDTVENIENVTLSKRRKKP